MTQIRAELAAKLRGQIHYRGMTKTELANRSGISRATIVNILNGTHAVSLENFLSIMDALSISPQRFLKDVLDYKKYMEISDIEEPNEKRRHEVNSVLKKALGGRNE